MDKVKLKEKWDLVLEEMEKDQDKSTKLRITTFFNPLIPVSINEKKSLLYCTAGSEEENVFVLNFINKYKELVGPATEKIFGKPYDIVINDGNSDIDVNHEVEEYEYFNPHYVFENFVSGPNNRLALAVSLAVAESYSKEYNPLFIYGGSGLGKTHLLHAIGHDILENQPSRKVLYVSSEVFTNEFITSIRDRKMDLFKDKYRNVDVLLLDDVQFIAGKHETEEELFHTFDALHNAGKQIVLSSDRPPKEIGNMPERLITRFSWGMIADIQPPDYETRVAILSQKASQEGFNLDKDLMEVIEAISENVPSNIRELEGAFTRVVGYGALINEKITKSLAKRVLTDIFVSTKKIITPDLIKKTVAAYYGIKVSDMESPKHARVIAYPRQIAIYLIRNNTEYSLPKIGEEFGGRDHTTILHSYKKIASEIENNEELKSTVEKIQKQLNE